MMNMHKAEQQLQRLGFSHAPIQGFSAGPGVDGRYLTIAEPPGRYYILGIDNGHRSVDREPKNVIQLLFFNVPDDDVGQVASRIGWVVTDITDLAVTAGGTCRSVMIAPASISG